jgi:hypothetical protein
MDGQTGARGRDCPRTRRFMAAMIAAILITTGCQGMAKTTQDVPVRGSDRIDNTVADWPLKFVSHSFGARCYATYGCTVDYNGFRHVSDPEDQLRPALEEVHPDALKNASVGYVGVRNFPAPAQVRWRSKDGAKYEAEVDIGKIFQDQLIVHEVARDEVAEGVSIWDPGILLVVEDRTIRVYMRAFIPTKTPQIPGNLHSSHRADWVIAWSKQY